MLRAAVLLSLAFFCSACNSASPTSPNSSRPSASPTFTTFDPLGSSTQGSLLFCSYGTYHQDINISGTIVGSFFDSNQTSHGFIRSSNGSFPIIDAPNSSAGCSQGTYLAAVNVPVLSPAQPPLASAQLANQPSPRRSPSLQVANSTPSPPMFLDPRESHPLQSTTVARL
jgi:hypothetical protein